MNKIALVGGAVLALSLLAAPAALAQDDDSCDAARKALVQAETRLANRAAQERVEELAELNAARVARNAARTALDGDPTNEGLKRAFADAKAALERAQEALDTDSRRLADLRAAVTIAIQERDEACADPTPTTTPPPTTVIEDPDVDCDEVSASRAQEILDADRSDPHNLDTDNDGVACEEDVVLNPPATVNVVVPRGGVATGGGPA